jgi:hypothetical protein
MDEPKFPEEIQCRITDEFLQTFKDELDKIFTKELNNLHCVLHKPKATYCNFYQWFDRSSGYYKALEIASSLHNFIELYDYINNLKYPVQDKIQISLTEMLYERGIIEEGTDEDSMPCPYN